LALIVAYDMLYRYFGDGSFVWRVVPIMTLLFLPTFVNMYPKTKLLKKIGINGKYLAWQNVCYFVVFLLSIGILAGLSIAYDIKKMDSFGWEIGIVLIFFVSFFLLSMVADLAVLSNLRKKYKVALKSDSDKTSGNGSTQNPTTPGRKPDARDIFE